MSRKRIASSHTFGYWTLLVALGVLLSMLACRRLAWVQEMAAPTATSTAANTATPTRTPTATWTPVPTETATAKPTATSTPVPTIAPTQAPLHTFTAAPSLVPSSTATATSTPVPTATPTVTPTSTPTPIVCDDISVITWMEIAPGQRFECATHQDAIAEQMRGVEQVPCQDVAVVFEDGRFSFTCKSRVNITVKGAITAQECELLVDMEGGLVGGGLMDVLIRSLLKNFPYDRICIEEAQLIDGKLIVRGYGR